MIYRFKFGAGPMCGRWTGAVPFNVWTGRAWIVQRSCPTCGLSTRKFRFSEETVPEEQQAALPVLLLTGGGRSSTHLEMESRLAGLHVTTWNDMPGGHAIVNPVMVLRGDSNPPPVKDSTHYVWVKTYETRSTVEYVLLRPDTSSHALRTVYESGQCPTCRFPQTERGQIEEKTTAVIAQIADMDYDEAVVVVDRAMTEIAAIAAQTPKFCADDRQAEERQRMADTLAYANYRIRNKLEAREVAGSARVWATYQHGLSELQFTLVKWLHANGNADVRSFIVRFKGAMNDFAASLRECPSWYWANLKIPTELVPAEWANIFEP